MVEQANIIIKNNHYSYFADIDETRVLIKYLARVNEKIRPIYAGAEAVNPKNNFKKRLR